MSLSDIDIFHYIFQNYLFWLYFTGIIQRLTQSMISNLYALTKTVTSSVSSGANVRWFAFKNHLTNIQCGYNMRCLNAIETGVTLYSAKVFLQALYLTTINETSLVFKLDQANLPNVLFSADSDFSFTNSPLPMKDKSIITVPHHGSSSCDNAYTLIGGANHIFVRSDRSQTQRPGNGYLKQLNRYCTICRNKGPKQKIDIHFTSGGLLVNANPCNC